jgi:hypothetical protein
MSLALDLDLDLDLDLGIGDDGGARSDRCPDREQENPDDADAERISMRSSPSSLEILIRRKLPSCTSSLTLVNRLSPAASDWIPRRRRWIGYADRVADGPWRTRAGKVATAQTSPSTAVTENPSSRNGKLSSHMTG